MSSNLSYCPHCNTYIAERTFRRHKTEYYDETSDSWETDLEAPMPKQARLDQFEIQSSANSLSNLEETTNEQDEIYFDSYSELTALESENFNVESIKLDPVDIFVEDKLDEVWENVTPDDVNQDLSVFEGRIHNSQEERSDISSLARWTILFVGLWSHHFRVSAAAVSYLLKFIQGFLISCGRFAPRLNVLSHIIPKSLYLLRKSQGCLEDDFVKYVVCVKCETTYKLSDINDLTTCTFVEFPNHAQRKFRQKCGTQLFKEVTLSDGKKKKYPLRTFCYRSVKKTLKNFLDRTGFQRQCEQWRNRIFIPGTLRDVYDGRVWKSFMKQNDKPFLEEPRRFGLMLNIDWFQPYKHSPYSSGGIYLSILNLPRPERSREENVFLAGIIPGPREPSKSINTYLRPLVDELLDLWENGFTYKGKDDEEEETYYVALMCCSCDIPATRKVCGFLGHTSKVGCSKCKKNFKTGKFGEKIDYGGFDNNNEPRTDHEHRKQATEIQQQKTISAKTQMEAKTGVRYTELMRLPYWNCITFSVIDPMHNLFLGTSKYMFKSIWADKLTTESLKDIQQLVDNMAVPTSLGRIPRKIESSFSSFTADQWKNWTLYYSPIVLKDYLPKKDYDCWMIFVEACRHLCTPSITVNRLKKGHEKIMEFCRTFETIYGSNAVTPNMHLHTHLVEGLLDYGPFHGYWLFSFERMNGLLGSYNTNQRSPEIQFMRKMLQSQILHGLEKGANLSEHFTEAFEFESSSTTETKDACIVQRLKHLSSCIALKDDRWLVDADIKFIGVRHDASFNDHYIEFLREAVRHLIEVEDSEVSGICRKYFSVEMCGELFGSSRSRLSRSSVVLASWCGREGDIEKNCFNIRPGVVRFFISFYVKYKGQIRPLTFAFVHWFQRTQYDFNSKLVSIWCRNMFEPEGPACFMPLQRISGKAICAQITVRNENVLAIIPHLRHLYF